MAAPDKPLSLLYTTVLLNDVINHGGYHRELFTRPFSILEEALVICTLCQGVKKDPCVYQGLTTCRTCSANPDKATPVREIREQVSRLSMRCPLFQRGCKWTGNIAEGESHVKHCKDLLYRCPNRCELGVSRRSMEEHVKTCSMRDIPCENCGVKTQAKNLDKHLLTCNLQPVSCPNCQVKFDRNKLGEHLIICANKYNDITHITNSFIITPPEDYTESNQLVNLQEARTNEYYANLEIETSKLKERVSCLERKNEVLTKALFTRPEIVKYDKTTGHILEGFKWLITGTMTVTKRVSKIESPSFYIWHHNLKITADTGVMNSVSFRIMRVEGLFDEIVLGGSLTYFRCEMVPVGEGDPIVLSDRIDHELNLGEMSQPFLSMDLSLLRDEAYCRDDSVTLNIYFDMTH